MTKIILNELEKKIALLIAKSRYYGNRGKLINQKLVAQNLSEIEPDIMGAESELAACKLLDVYPTDLFTLGTKGVASGLEMGDVEYNGLRIDVKTTPWQTGCLLSNSKNKNIDVFMLMVGKNGDYECRGAIQADTLYNDINFGDNNGKFKRACWYLQQTELQDYKKVLDLAA